MRLEHIVQIIQAASAALEIIATFRELLADSNRDGRRAIATPRLPHSERVRVANPSHGELYTSRVCWSATVTGASASRARRWISGHEATRAL